MGRLAIAVWSRVDVRTVLVVSTRGDSATTVTSSGHPAHASETLRVTVDADGDVGLALHRWRPLISKVTS
jgi:hypothetical protein